MNALLEISNIYPELCAIENIVKEKRTPVLVSGVTGAQKNHLIYSVAKKLGKKALVITGDISETNVIKEDLEQLFNNNVLLFKQKEYVFYDVEISTKDIECERIKTLASLKDASAIVATASSLMQYTLPKEMFEKYRFGIKVSDEFDLTDLSKKLVEMGYKRVSQIEAMGQFSIRGSILDIFTPCHKNPMRIEFFGDEVDSVREFDLMTQISIENAKEVLIIPVREMIYDDVNPIIEKIQKLKNENFYSDIQKLTENGYFPSMDKYLPFVYEALPTLFDYLDDDYIVFVDEYSKVSENIKFYDKEQNEIITNLLDKGLFPKSKKSYFLNNLDNYLSKPSVYLSAVMYAGGDAKIKEVVNISAKTLPSYSGKTEFLYDDLNYWKQNGYRVILLISSKSKLDSIKTSLENEDIDAQVTESLDKIPNEGQIIMSVGSLSKSFEYPTIKTVVLSDKSFAPSSVKKKRHRTNSKNAIKSFDELHIGDYVVHRTHGIGQYIGIKQLVVDGITKDYIQIKYKNGDYLYVPTNQLDFIHKYVGAEAKNVKLNKLGGVEWHKTTQKVKESVMELAEDLIKLYAERNSLKGYVYPPDTPWQKQFEDDFKYEETFDQLKSINEVKADMEKGKIMDRLLCGDVGYGKTEVAIRAAFKTVMEGKQVAYLVPTTILAQQHYNTFKERMSEYCINVEMMSRFRTKKQQEKTVVGLKNGSLDVVIGTHRILSKDVAFKDLGLLIIDEEQRFGVGHKEAIKKLKNNVNVLTLSATPIPRTLNMALVGIRDLSVLSEPPENRYPIQTFILERNESVIKTAIDRELARGGQVYYLFNRVENIEVKTAQIRNMFPDARIAYAHGKMTENMLEGIMIDFLNGDIDILVCTTIIETGLDVSNVNTIIIEDADKLGLSQLYQLRGRVGRSNRLAYAYMTYEKSKVLDSVAQKRLQAIKEFTEFGSGFKIAMRDLEIRGAGNLLGKQQHGNMNLVGYDMYCMLLERAVKELKGETVSTIFETTIELNFDAYIPEKYIMDENVRIEMYKKIADICDEEDALNISDELIDRFGEYGTSVDNLIKIAYIKSLCIKLDISKLTQKDGLIIFTFNKNVSTKAIVDILADKSRKIMFSSGEKSYLSYKYNDDVLNNIKIILQSLLKSSQEDKSDI
ncbi:MAG: transcription-repair coupling factor [Ruminococcaceae bacterium]|nr:transcription-repair coupling factor [Oscillospiraceae bacterium]